MEKFEFYSPTHFIYENDADLKVGSEVKKYSDNVLFVHYGDSFTYDSGLHNRIVTSLKDAGIKIYELPGVEPNPKVSLVREGVKICKDNNIEFVLAVGGGSVIDTAKAVALGAKSEHDVWDYFTKKEIVTDALKVGTIMTLPATGSEASGGAVITNEETGENLDVIADAFLRPTFTLLNPLLTLGIPKRQSGFGIIDMFSHVLERYMSSSNDVYVTDYMSEGLMKAIIINGNKVMENPSNVAARSELMWAAIVAHNGVIGVGRQQDWSSHVMAAQLSANYNTVHGLALSVIIPSWAYQVRDYNLMRFVQFSNRVFDIEIDFYNLEATANQGIKMMQEFFINMGGETTLSAIGVQDDKLIEKMATDAVRFGTIGNIKALNKTDVIEIYKRILK